MVQSGRNLIIVRRQSPDWSTIDLETFASQSRAFCKALSFPPDLVSEMVGLWDATFNVPYFQVRQQMKVIASDNLAGLENAVLLENDALITNELPSNVWVSFVDDDDWFRPDMWRFFPSPSDLDAVIWRHSGFGKPGPDAVILHSETGHVYTNNYAVTANYLRAHGSASVFQHWEADATLSACRVARLPSVLSMTNKHPASALSLRRIGLSLDPQQRMGDLISEYNRRTAILECPQEAIWALPMIRRVRSYFEALFVDNWGVREHRVVRQI